MCLDFSKRTRKPDLTSHQWKRKSIYLLNFVQVCVNTGHWNKAIAAVINRNPFVAQDMQVSCTK